MMILFIYKNSLKLGGDYVTFHHSNVELWCRILFNKILFSLKGRNGHNFYIWSFMKGVARMKTEKNLSWCPHDNLPPSHSSFSPLHPWGLFFRSTRRRDPTTSLFTNSSVLCIEHKMEKDFIISLNVFFSRKKTFTLVKERK